MARLRAASDRKAAPWSRAMPSGACTAPLEATPYHLLRQGHCVANAVAQGLFIIGHRIRLVPAEWKRLGSEVQFRRSVGAMT